MSEKHCASPASEGFLIEGLQENGIPVMSDDDKDSLEDLYSRILDFILK